MQITTHHRRKARHQHPPYTSTQCPRRTLKNKTTTHDQPQAMKHPEPQNTAHQDEIRLGMDSKFMSHFTFTSKWERCAPFSALVQ